MALPTDGFLMKNIKKANICSLSEKIFVTLHPK